MSSSMSKRRTLLIGGAANKRVNLREDGRIMVEICEELEPLLRQMDFVGTAPFETISLIIRYGCTRCETPEYGKIDRVHGELPIAVELELDMLRRVDRNELKRQFLDITLAALIDVAKVYRLPHDELVSKQAALRSCDAWPRQGSMD